MKKLVILISSVGLLSGCIAVNNIGCSQSPYFSATTISVCQYPPNIAINGGFTIGLAFNNSNDSVTSASIPMPAYGNQQFRAKARYSDNQNYDTTNLVIWRVKSSTNGIIASFDLQNKGLLKISSGMSGVIVIQAILRVPNQNDLTQDFNLQIVNS